jgi:hypothetical protein
MKFNELDSIAHKHNVLKTKSFSQNTYINGTELLNPAIQNGACRALSAAFLVRNFSRAAMKSGEDDTDQYMVFGPKKFFEAFHTRWTQSDEDKKRFDKIATVQTAYAKQGKMEEHESIDAAKKSVAALSNRMLQYVTYRPAITHGGAEVVGPNILPDAVGYWLLSSGGHMMAVAIRKDGNTKAKFFDPNAGLATFGDTGHLRAFLGDYFKAAKYDQINFIEFKC